MSSLALPAPCRAGFKVVIRLKTLEAYVCFLKLSKSIFLAKLLEGAAFVYRFTVEPLTKKAGFNF